mmetsp:Transcript_72469/g.223956  ORF Transcript_72469/g.223956 Transcript_72469/m.223956 type:complete len:218 (+) Transcript_72469:1141-1794(+)
MPVGLEAQFPRPCLGAVVTIESDHAHEYVVVVFSPGLQLREVQRKRYGLTNRDVAHQEAVRLDDRVEGIHLPESTRRAPEQLGALGILGMLKVVVGEAVRALHQARQRPPAAHDVARRRDRPLSQLIPESDSGLVANTLSQVQNIHLCGGRRHWIRLLLYYPGSRRVDELPGPRSQGPEPHDDARQGRDRREELPLHAHVALRLVDDEESGLLWSTW